ncbi:hypothetical protein [Natrinema marinum]|uniref:hypothetical protein n=1 Tax=Natrinema marinum TaxID=2961598 RepID=UPI0020C9289E|nr:hypothetical protein [Natrinema marinum]
MRDARLVGAGFALALLLAGVVSAITASPAVLGTTPVGIAVYLAIGVGLPQYLLSRHSGSRLQLGLAALAVVGATVAMIAGVVTGSPNAEWSGGLVAILFVVVVGNVVGAGVHEFRAGYRSRS